ncbi:MAG TPA: peptidoglycan recognition family protein [Pyrinomonadaceae bacterium]|jgi:hypothetical protein
MSQRTPANSTLLFSKIVERYAHFFERPEARLRFLNKTLSQQAVNSERLDQALGRFEFIKKSKLYERLLELWFYRSIFEELEHLLPSAAKQRRQILRANKAPLSARLFFRCYQLRYPLCALGAVMLAISLFGVYRLLAWTAGVNGPGAQSAQAQGSPHRAATVQNGAFAAASAKYLPDYRAEKVWLVEQKENSERYSNAGRILTDYETSTHARGYYLLQREPGVFDARVRREPVGIVYHTSESDLLSFTPDNNDSIETHSRGLLEYVKRHKSYNYVIDRYGQIHRIVRDDHAANHAGNSVWADAEGVYVGLNESFIGVCFETNSEAGSNEEQLTEAQLIAGRLLTQILRSRYNIADADCVTHGLVSVNPGNMLICFHHDWARNFPFEAMGLSDKYKVAPVSISDFGFTYDEQTVDMLGGAIWPGAREADVQFKRRAAEASVAPEELRRQMRSRYRQQMELQRRLRSDSAEEPEIGLVTSPAHFARPAKAPATQA